MTAKDITAKAEDIIETLKDANPDATDSELADALCDGEVLAAMGIDDQEVVEEAYNILTNNL